jgi:hypothetical protein
MIHLNKYLLYLHEKENSEVLNFKKRNKFMYMYHGTRSNDNIIKKQGLKKEKMGEYIQKTFPEFRNKKGLFFTSWKGYAKSYADMKKGFFEKGSIILAKLNTKKLKLLVDSYLRSDEYIYYDDVPPKDLVFPNEPQYKIIEKKYNYLKPKISFWLD